MYSQQNISDCNNNSNQLTCGKCAYTWLEFRGLPPDKITCPRCKNNIIRRGLVQFGRVIRNQPRSAIDEIIEILEFTEGDGTYQRRSLNNLMPDDSDGLIPVRIYQKKVDADNNAIYALIRRDGNEYTEVQIYLAEE